MDPLRAALQRYLTDGENLRSGLTGRTAEALAAFRQQYLAWVDDVHRALRDRPNELRACETTRWRMVVEGRVSDDELVRTILGDLDKQLSRVRALLDSLEASEPDPATVPPRWIADPGTVGMAVFDANCLFSKHTRHLLLGFSVHGIVLGRWSRELLVS